MKCWFLNPHKWQPAQVFSDYAVYGQGKFVHYGYADPDWVQPIHSYAKPQENSVVRRVGRGLKCSKCGEKKLDCWNMDVHADVVQKMYDWLNS